MGLTVGNPKGFATPLAITVRTITLKIDTSTVAGSGPIVIKEIHIDKPQVTYEVGNTGLISMPSGKIPRLMSAGHNAPTSSGGQERKLIINDLYVRDGQIGVSATALQDKALDAPLPTIHLTNIGKSTTALRPRMANDVLGAIISQAARPATTTHAMLGSSVTSAGQGRHRRRGRHRSRDRWQLVVAGERIRIDETLAQPSVGMVATSPATGTILSAAELRDRMRTPRRPASIKRTTAESKRRERSSSLLRRSNSAAKECGGNADGLAARRHKIAIMDGWRWKAYGFRRL